MAKKGQQQNVKTNLSKKERFTCTIITGRDCQTANKAGNPEDHITMTKYVPKTLLEQNIVSVGGKTPVLQS